MITADDLKRFAPKARPEYVTALLGGLDHLRAAGILENPYRLCHFMAQCGHETDGFTISRESLHYTSAKRLREVWPSRFRNKSDADLRPLLKNGLALGDAVYMGRMGNNLPGDGFNYRGGGFLQTTGKSAVAKYAEACDMEPSADLLDNIPMTLRFACVEWLESNCCEFADENDITKVSKAINVGSATSNVKPVGIADRQRWFAKAWGIWGDKGKPDRPVVSADVVDAVKGAAVKYGIPATAAAGGTAHVATKTTQPAPAKPVAPPTKDTIAKTKERAKEVRETVEVAKDYATWGRDTVKAAQDNWMILAPVAAVLIVAMAWPKIKERLA